MKFGLIISKQHPPGVSMVERFREHIEQVRAARDAGFDLIVMGQHYLSAPFQEIQTLPSLPSARLDWLVGPDTSATRGGSGAGRSGRTLQGDERLPYWQRALTFAPSSPA